MAFIELNLDSNAEAALVGALAGSIIAFMFSRLSEFLNAIRRGKRNHHNALVMLANRLVDQGSIANDNVYLIPHFQSALREGKVYWSQLSIMPVGRDEKDAYLKFQDLVLVNHLHTYLDGVRKINDDILGLQRAYSKLEQAFIQSHINEESYKVNGEYLAEQMDAIKYFLDDFLEDSLPKLSARVRVLIDRSSKKPSQKLRRFLLSRGHEVSDDEIQTEVAVIKKEVEQSAKESKKKIAEIEKLIAKKTK